MLRIFNMLALTVLVGTAGWAYQTKYETIRYAEEVRKLENKVEKERDTIAILKAEWQLLNRPARIEELATKLDLKPLKPTQIARAQDLPERGKEVDHIGAKLDQLLTGSISTPAKPASAGTTPSPRLPGKPQTRLLQAAKPKPATTPAGQPAQGRGTPQTKAAPSQKIAATATPAGRKPMSLMPGGTPAVRAATSPAAAPASRYTTTAGTSSATPPKR